MGAEENAAQTAILQYLKLRGVFCWRSNNQGRYMPKIGKWIPTAGIKGVADILGVIGGGKNWGKFLAVEVKSAKGKLSMEQEIFLAEIRAAGGVAFCSRSVSDCEKELRRIL